MQQYFYTAGNFISAWNCQVALIPLTSYIYFIFEIVDECSGCMFTYFLRNINPLKISFSPSPSYFCCIFKLCYNCDFFIIDANLSFIVLSILHHEEPSLLCDYSRM